MKKTILIIILILCLPLVYSLIGGNQETIFDGECSELLVNITIDPTQDIGEYTLEPDCSVIQELIDNYKVFECICKDNRTTLILSPAINSVGNYTITIDQYKLIDNESTEPVEYNITNPSTENTTITITLPNNITIDRILEPNESLVYVETEDYVIIPEEDVTFEKIETDNNNINLICIASGTKCFDIYTENGKPYSVNINGTSISFDYDDITKLIHFCTTFSTKGIAITWDVPPQPSIPSDGVSGGRGGSSGAFTIRFTDKPRTLMLKPNIISRFWVNSKQHTIEVKYIFNDSVDVEIERHTWRLYLNKTKLIDIEQDMIDDLKLTLKEIRGRVVFIEFEKISEINETIDIEEVILEEEHPIEEMVTISEEPKEEVEEVIEDRKINIGLIIVLSTLFVGLIVYLIIINRKKPIEEEK